MTVKMRGSNFVRNLRRNLTGDGRPPPTLLRLAKQGKFDEMAYILNGEDRQQFLDECASAANHDGVLNLFMGQSTLQSVMAYRPTVELVELLITRMSEHNSKYEPEDSIDMQGRTPLHVAVTHGCDLPVVHRLMNDVTHSLPALMKDQQDRTPLHYACANPRGIRSSRWHRHSSSRDDAENMFQIVCSLIRAYPEATEIQDLAGKTPVDLAIENKADHRVLSVLVTAAGKLVNCSKKSLENSFTIVSDCTSDIFVYEAHDDDLSSVGSRGVSEAGVRHASGKKKKKKKTKKKKKKKKKRADNFEGLQTLEI